MSRIASFMLWVTIMVIRLFSLMIWSERVSTFSAVLGSRAAVCSSSIRSLGLFRVAMRRVRACLWPPDRSPTFSVILFSSPSPSVARRSLYSSFSAFVTPGFRPRFWPLRLASARFSMICIVAAVPIIGSWKTRPSHGARLCSLRPEMSVPSMTIFPSSTCQTPAIALSRVDFPAPFPPIIVTKSPSSRWRDTPFRATFSLMVFGLNVFLRLIRSSILGSFHQFPFPVGYGKEDCHDQS